LQGVDSYLWYNESPTNHMHTLKVAVFETSSSAVPYSAETFTRTLDERMHLLPSFRWRLLETPFGLHHPVWVADPEFDITRHVFRVQAAAPGGSREMDDAIGRIASVQLRRDRPLWEVHLIEGLAGGKVAAVAKIHHAMADGGAAANQLLNVTETERDDGVPPPLQPWLPAPLPLRRDLIMAALKDHPRQARKLPSLLARTGRGLRRSRRFWRQHSDIRARPWTGQRTFLNETIDARRCFATTTLSLAEVQALRATWDYTINDIVLGVVSAALRTIMIGRGESVARPLVANVPAATGLRADRLYGNSVGLLFTGLPVHLSEHRERLNYIHRGVQVAREANEALGPTLLDDWLQLIPPMVFKRMARFNANSKWLARRPPMSNMVASNVRGPAEKVSLGDYTIVDVFSVGPLDIGMALNVTVWSYADHLNFTVLTCPEQIPDPHVVTDGCQEAFASLCGQLIGPAGSAPTRPYTA
jgi:diacylglycerol O-acyltransferase